MMHNFTAYCQKEGDFLKYHRANWPCKQVAFFHGWTVKGAESNILMCKPHSILKTLGLIRSHTRTTKAANSKAFMCKLCEKATHSKGIITWVTEAMRMNSVLPVSCFWLCWFAWPPGKRDYLEKFHQASRHHNSEIPANRARSVVI